VVILTSLEKLKPEEKVNIAINMTDVCTRITADGIRDLYRDIKDEELLEKIRERISYGRCRHFEV
jgi:hypothetical protein